jgi:uncharacterized protein
MYESGMGVMSVIDTLLADLPVDGRVSDVYVGVNWVLSVVQHDDGTQSAGVAGAPREFASAARFPIGYYVSQEDAVSVARWLASDDQSAASVGLATFNALQQRQAHNLSDVDGADWLSVRCVDRKIALFGRFPFIEDEVRPFARQVWVFEQAPQGDELSASQMADVLPQAEVVAITSSSIINHTIDAILAHVALNTTVALLGPSTPLTSKLFDSGIHALFGVWVADVEQVIRSVRGGEGFQKMRGLRRKSLLATQQAF